MSVLKKIIIFLNSDIRKYIPFSFQVKSLYWVQKEKEITEDFRELFSLIDYDEYQQADGQLKYINTVWKSDFKKAPKWFKEKYEDIECKKALRILSVLTRNN